MLDTVIDCFVQTLCSGGIDAVKEYPAVRFERKIAPVVSVGAKTGKLSGSGMGEYMGISRDDSREIYAMRLELVLGIDIFSPIGCSDGCIGIFEKISALLPQLPSGLRPSALVCGEVSPDSETRMLRCPCELHCTASLTCEADAERGEFLDFTLKGVLRK